MRRLAAESPHLAAAAEFQIAVCEAERRIEARVQLPRTLGRPALLAERLAAGERVVEIDDLALDLSDVRRLLREAADLLLRFQMIDAADEAALQTLIRDATALPSVLRDWYDGGGEGAQEQALLIAMRPHLARAASAVLPRLDLAVWTAASCPVCGGAPDFAVWNGEVRRLMCGRCTGQWPFDASRCPFCEAAAGGQRRTFADASRVYRVEACDDCRRYLKGLDEARAGRPVLPAFDPIATLPLDAAAVQMGYA